MNADDEKAFLDDKELAETQERLHLVLNAAEASTWNWDVGADRIFWSDNLEPQLAMPSNSFVGRYTAFLELVHPEDRERVSQAVNRALYEGANYHIEFRMVRADGTIRWSETRGKVARDESGKPLRMSGVDLDITERKEAEEQLRRSEAEARARAAELQAILDAVPGMVFIAQDASGHKVAGSKSAYELLRLRPGANPSKSAPEAERPNNFRIMRDGQEVPTDELPLQKAAATGQAIRNAELTLAFDDGTSIDILGNSVPLLNEDGSSRGAVSAFIDITGLKRTDRQLRETERELHEAQRLARSGSWTWYPKTDTVTWTKGLCRIFGHDPELPAPSFAEQASLYTAESLLRLRAAVERTFKTGEEYELELDVIRPEGSIARVVTHAEAKRDESGDVVMLYGSVQDLTERKQAEEELRASEERLRFVADRANVGIWHWDLLSDTLEWSPLCKQLFGIPQNEKMSYARFLAAVHPDDRDATDLANRGYLEKGGPGYDKEYRVVWPDGTVRWIHAKGSATFENGRPIRMAGIVLDVTERKYTEEELRLSTERFQVALKDSSIVVFNQDLDLRYTWIYNPALGYSASDVIGRRDIDIFERAQDGEVTEAIKREVIRSGVAQRQEVVIHWRGVDRCYDLLVEPLRDPNGDVVGVTCAAIDITTTKQAEEALRKSHLELEQKVQERTSELSASLKALGLEVETRKQTEAALQKLSAHLLQLQDEERRRVARDLHDSTGQTLTAMKMSLSFLESFVRDSPQASTLLADLKALTDDAVQDIRTTSHLLHPPLLDELGFQSATKWYVEELTNRSGIKARLDLTAAAGTLSKDSELALFRVLQESLTNIVRHSGSKTADISFQSNAETAILMIRDYGRGIPAEKLNSFNETGTGVGVGLGGMKQRIRERGGYFRVSSDGSGTCVTAILPVARDEKAGAENSPAAGSSPA